MWLMSLRPDSVVLSWGAPILVKTELSSDAWSGNVVGMDMMSEEFDVDDMMSDSIIDNAGSDCLSCGVILLRRFMMVGGLHCCQVCKSSGVLSGSSCARFFSSSGERFSPMRALMLLGSWSNTSEYA